MNNNWLGLEGDVCVITGAVGGMGAEICREFAKQKANLVLIDLNETKCQDFASELAKEYGIKAIGLACNTTDEKSVDNAVALVKQQFGRCDVLVNTAAILKFCPLEDLPLDEWQLTIDVNMTGYFLMSQRLLRIHPKPIVAHIAQRKPLFPCYQNKLLPNGDNLAFALTLFAHVLLKLHCQKNSMKIKK